MLKLEELVLDDPSSEEGDTGESMDEVDISPSSICSSGGEEPDGGDWTSSDVLSDVKAGCMVEVTPL